MLCFRKFPVKKKFMDKRERERGGGGQDFLSKNFCLKVPKDFAGNPSVLCFRTFRWGKISSLREGESIKIFR